MSKQNATLTALGQIQADTQDAYLSAPMIAAPNTQITDLSGNARTIHDPSKTLRPLIGFERVLTQSIQLSPMERVSTGDPVWRLDNGDERFRFVGNWSTLSSNLGSMINANPNDYLEITFYGTGLNILTLIDATARDHRAAVDGGANGANFYPSGGSPVLINRQYNPNQVLKVVSGLALGTHTVKITHIATSLMYVYGFEIVNESTSVSVPKGEVVSAGKKEVIAAATSTAYNSGFDGSPTLNGRGGHVVVYSKNGVIGKVLQQTDASSANYPSATHANEEIIRRINWREFGVDRADDFVTLAGASARAFALNDGTTNLSGTSVLANAASGGLAISNANNLILTFVGTGLDIYMTNPGAGTVDTVNVSVDGGGSFGPIPAAGNTSGGLGYQKIISGLPYGSHTVKFSDTGGGAFEWVIYDMIVYGPKKPTIPDGSIQIGEYYLLADFAVQNATGTSAMSTGTVRKANTKEMVYAGTWTATLNTNNINGWVLASTTTNDFIQYVFFGTGFDFRFASTATSTTFQMNLDGSTNVSGFTNSSFGTGITSWTPATGTVVTSTTAVSGNRVAVSGLTLGLHTIKITKTAGTGAFDPETFDIITPLHFPDTNRGSLSMNPSAAFPMTKDEVGNIDLGKAKAWVYFDGANSDTLASNNIAAVFKRATGKYQVFFEKPFRDSNYVVVATADVPTNNFQNAQVEEKRPNYCLIGLSFTTTGGASDDGMSAAFFGQLANEDE